MVTFGQQPPVPVPLLGESQPDFAIRAHAALSESVPVTSRRNQMILDAWRKGGSSNLLKLTHEHFPDDKFAHATDVPVFAEHTKERVLRDASGNQVTDDKGQPQTQVEKYDLPALRAICERCNHRIADTRNFAAISKGHTPSEDQLQNGAQQPPLLGFAGPFHLGMIGDQTPRWAIFQDEHYWHETAPDMQRLPTRSVEVWLAPEMGDRFFDPIAALGTETPKLDMGVRFSRLSTGELVERYSACFAGAGNVAVPGPVSTRHKYSEPQSEETDMPMTPEDVQQIVAAVMQTKPMQWLESQMLAAQNEAANDNDADNLGGTGDPAAAPPAEGAGGPPAVPAAPAAETDDPNKDKNGMAMYSREGERERYARLEREHKELQARLSVIENGKRQAERYSKLQGLRSEHAFDLKKEAERCSKLTDQQFLDHVVCIRENYAKIPAGMGLPVAVGEHYTEPGEKDKYARRVSERALEIALAGIDFGKHVSYEQARAEAVKELGPEPK